MNDKLYRDIGKRIKLARRACSITQERLAEMVGVTNQHISNIEVGNITQLLKSQTVLLIAFFLQNLLIAENTFQKK